MVAKLTRLTHKIVIKLHLVAESCTICSSHSRQPVQKLLDTPKYSQLVYNLLKINMILDTFLIHLGTNLLLQYSSEFQKINHIISLNKILNRINMFLVLHEHLVYTLCM
jgi:hypothetical protein